MNFDFWKREWIFYKIQLSSLSPRGLEMINSWGDGGGSMVVASMYQASRIVVKPINCKHTSILVDNMLLLEPWDMISANVVWYWSIAVCKQNIFQIVLLLQTLRYVPYKCNALFNHYCVYSKRFDLIINFCTALNICLFWTKVSVISPQSRP